MRLLHMFIFGLLCTFMFSSAMRADCADSLLVTMFDLECEMVESEDGEIFIEINDTWHTLNALYVDVDGFCYLKTGKKHESVSDSEDSELGQIFKCPCRDCGTLQSVSLLKKNKYLCSRCWQNVFTCPRYQDFDGSPSGW